MDREEALVARVVEAAGGEIVGRVRLQKVFYLLDRLGMESGFSYSYHHYGPYSADLADAVDGAKAFRFVSEEPMSRRSDGMSFGVFRTGSEPLPPDPSMVGKLSRSEACRFIEKMSSNSSTVLELAATIDWLRTEMELTDWRSELSRRKGPKTEKGRTEEAIALLNELGLKTPA